MSSINTSLGRSVPSRFPAQWSLRKTFDFSRTHGYHERKQGCYGKEQRLGKGRTVCPASPEEVRSAIEPMLAEHFRLEKLHSSLFYSL